MFRPPVNSFLLQIPSVADGTRPAAAWGTSVTPGTNTYGSYASVLAGASVTQDVYGILINLNSFATSASARDALVKIGLDASGGSSFTDFISHLLASCASTYLGSGITTGMGGVWYYFPVFIKAGTSIGACASVNNGTVGTGRVAVTLMCQPSRPDLIRVGSFVRTFGEDTANSRGTLVTQGTVAEGAYTQLGSALAEPLWFFEHGCGCNNATMASGIFHQDIAIGDASNKRIALLNKVISATASETIAKQEVLDGFCRGAIGDLVYGRSQSSAAADANVSMMAYGVGG